MSPCKSKHLTKDSEKRHTNRYFYNIVFISETILNTISEYCVKSLKSALKPDKICLTDFLISSRLKAQADQSSIGWSDNSRDLTQLIRHLGFDNPRQ